LDGFQADEVDGHSTASAEVTKNFKFGEQMGFTLGATAFTSWWLQDRLGSEYAGMVASRR
jgi:hypothetical protein